ncbi:Wzz/FepE/Etk N-terminal domain-containing protein [SAR86 cluster bacterium]|nr:Wzz/FepE/Etk N-terminal domain-containing protein [SAR86 cluster bacterium]
MQDNLESRKDFNIDIVEIFQILIGKRFQLFLITLTFSILAVIYSLTLDNYYKSSSTFQISIETNNNSATSGISSIASLAGISVGQQDSKVSFVKETLLSRAFFKRLIEKDNEILPNLLAFNYFDGTIKKSIFDKSSYDKGEWKIRKPTYLEGYEEFKDIFQVEIDDVTGFIKVFVTHKSPVFASNLIYLSFVELNLLSREKDISETKNLITYLEQEFSNTPILDIRESINNLITSQLRKKMYATVKQDYLVKFVEPPFVPERKSGPVRSLICIFITLLGFMFGVVYILLKRYLIIRNN